MDELTKIDLKPLTRAVAYRPFDVRWTVWNRNVAVHRRERVMRHMIAGTLGLIFVRQISHANQSRSVYALATEDVIDNRMFVSAKGIAFIEPLRLEAGTENFSSDFRTFLDARYDYHYSPEEILGYIYAVLHAPSYRSRNAEFLRIDFPRIPFPETKLEFDKLSDLGWALVQVHLLKALPKRATRLGVYHGKGDHAVETVRYAPEDAAVWINKTQRFAPVPEAVWEFFIGGYQVLDKYLKSRKGRTLSLDETTHVGRVAEALAFTIEQMEEIDAAYRASFPAGDKPETPLASNA